MANFALARLFYEMASLLEAREASVFRVRAYQRAAQTLETLAEDVAAVAARGELTALPGIGRDLAARIGEYLATGRIAQLDELRATLPAAFLTFLEIRGLGPRTARALADQGVESVEQLEAMCRSRQIIGVAGIRDKTAENILKAIERWKAGQTRTLLASGRTVAAQVAEALRAHGGVERLEIAGSLRRMRETVKDIDLLVTSTEPARVIGTLTTLPSVTEVIVQGPTKASVRHQDGLQIDLRVVEPAAFGAALQYFTGSKDHNVRVREIASRRGSADQRVRRVRRAHRRARGRRHRGGGLRHGGPALDPARAAREPGRDRGRARGPAADPGHGRRHSRRPARAHRLVRRPPLARGAGRPRPRRAATSTSSCPIIRARPRSPAASAWRSCGRRSPPSARCSRDSASAF